VDELGIRLLRPAPWSRIELVGEDAHGRREGHALRAEIRFAPVLPVETGAGKSRVRQPGDRDVVEDVVAREAFGYALEDARHQLVAARVVIEEIGGQADG